MPKYKIAQIENGALCHGDERYEVVDGVVECPVEFMLKAEVVLVQVVDLPAPADEKKSKK